MAASIRNNCARVAAALLLAALGTTARRRGTGASGRCVHLGRGRRDFRLPHRHARILRQRARDAGTDVDPGRRGQGQRRSLREQSLEFPEVRAHPHQRSGAAVGLRERRRRRRTARARACGRLAGAIRAARRRRRPSGARPSRRDRVRLHRRHREADRQRVVQQRQGRVSRRRRDLQRARRARADQSRRPGARARHHPAAAGHRGHCATPAPRTTQPQPQPESGA